MATRPRDQERNGPGEIMDSGNIAEIRSLTARATRLADRIMLCPPKIRISKGLPKPMLLTGVGCRNKEIATVPVRYILQPEVAFWCCELVRSADGYLDTCNPRMKMPHDSFWLEWPSEDATSRHSFGALVNSGPDGRSGEIHSWWASEGAIPDLNVLSVEFDLDAPMAKAANGRSAFAVRNAALPQLDDLLSHVIARLDPSWEEFLARCGREKFPQLIQECMDNTWYLLPQILAFVAVLESRTPLTFLSSDLSRLNKARQRRGKLPLLDHAEIGLDLARGSILSAEHGGNARTRQTPRLHHVRGHLVHRGETTFWRAPHLRGDIALGVVRQTVTVRRSA
ncbi:hypothetical protein [Pelagerythrobacter aerophilus]